MLRNVDFKRREHAGKVGTVERIEYDPNRTAFIALVSYEGGAQSYILAPQRVKAGDRVVSGEQVDIKPATRCRSATCRWAPSCTTSS